MVLPRAKSIIVLGSEVPVLDDVAERGCLPVGRAVLTNQQVPTDRALPSYLDLIKMRGEPCREELERPCEVQARPSAPWSAR